MATDTYNYTQDPQFLSAPPEQQHAYLMSNDPEYAQAHPDQQKAYIGHVNGGTHGEREAALSPPIAGVTHNTPQKGISGDVKGGQNPLGIDIGMKEAEEPSEEAIGRATGAIGAFAPAMVSPVTTVGALAGGTIGAPLVSSGARKTVGALGGSERAQDIAGRVGGYAGAIGGSLLGGGAAGSFEGLPEESTIAGVKFRTPKFIRKSPFEPSEGYSNPLGPERGEFEAEQEKNLIDQGKLAKIPNKVKPPFEQKPPLPQRAYAEMNQDITEGKQARAAARDTAHEDLAQARMRRGREQERIDEGLTPEGSNQKVTTVPEPNKPAPGENPNNQQSVKRRTTLVENAKRGKEGAGLQLNQIKGPVLYEPKGVVGTNPRPGGTVSFDEQGNPITPVRGAEEGRGLTNPQQVLERRGSPRATALNSAPPDPVREARLDSLRKIVRDPTTLDRDRAIAQSQLNDMESNPGERNELGENPSQLKKPKPTMSREEAEEASRKRTEGRNARFGGNK